MADESYDWGPIPDWADDAAGEDPGVYEPSEVPQDDPNFNPVEVPPEPEDLTEDDQPEGTLAHDNDYENVHNDGSLDEPIPPEQQVAPAPYDPVTPPPVPIYPDDATGLV